MDERSSTKKSVQAKDFATGTDKSAKKESK
jgi:hypothetical protein